jgi:hypothetical protein
MEKDKPESFDDVLKDAFKKMRDAVDNPREYIKIDYGCSYYAVTAILATEADKIRLDKHARKDGNMLVLSEEQWKSIIAREQKQGSKKPGLLKRIFKR